MFLNPPGPGDLELPTATVLVLGLAIVGFALGIAWLRRITRGPEDRDDHWRYRR
jgi:hypothetical protein